MGETLFTMAALNWITEFVCGIGFLMGLVWLFNKRWWFGGVQYLATYLLFFSLIFLEQNLYWTVFYIRYPHLLLLTEPLALMLGPLLFLYHRGRYKGETSKTTFLHFLPVVVIFLVYLPVYLMGASEKVEFVKNTIWQGQQINAFHFVLFRVVLISQIIGYGYYIQMKRKFGWSFRSLFSSRIPFDQLLLASFFTYGILRIIWLLYTQLAKYEYINYMDSAIRVVTALSIFYLFIQVINKIKITGQGPSYANSPIENGEINLLKERLQGFMQGHEPYLNKNLKMIEIASGLNISEHKLSQLLNIHLGTNFFEFINYYRIRKARLLLKDPEYNKFTIETIARECGFNSKSTFNEAFKRIEGITPSIYKKQP